MNMFVANATLSYAVQKNLSNTLMKNLLDACAAAVAFYTCGFGLAYGSPALYNKTFIGISNFFLRNEGFSYSHFFYSYSLSTASVTIVASALAERSTMTAYLFYAFLLAGFVYPVVVHAVWTETGYLVSLFGTSMRDFAGSGVVHMTGGMTALIASVILGPRKGRFYEMDGKQHIGLTKRSSDSLQLLGTFVLWFGWYGFNAGSALFLDSDEQVAIASLAVINTTLGGASGCLSALFAMGLLSQIRTGEFRLDLGVALNGCLSGLVAITAGCGIVEPGASVAIGLIAGIVYLSSKRLLETIKVDDAVDAIPVHLFNGMWGVFSTGLLASPNRLDIAYGDRSSSGWLYSISDFSLMGAQLVGILAILLWITVTMFPLFKLLDGAGCFRVGEVDELVGLGEFGRFLRFNSIIFLLDAAYVGEEVPTCLFDEDSDDSKKRKERLEAYQQRYEQKRLNDLKGRTAATDPS